MDQAEKHQGFYEVMDQAYQKPTNLTACNSKSDKFEEIFRPLFETIFWGLFFLVKTYDILS